MQRGSTANDRFAIGVAVADSPRGPWRDAHPAGPIISQTLPVANDIQNIDPTVIDDDDGRVYIYWGTFGQLRALEPAPDMVTPKGPERTVHGLTGFFEAPWIFKRNGTYYLLYAGNRAGPDSDCTAAVYHACQAYGTAPSPMGPWTYRGVLLRPVSSTTSHAGAVAFKGQWYLAYRTADAKGGGHFRRSVALDRMEWDDTTTPSAIRMVTPTRAPAAAPAPDRNIAPAASAAASNEPIPVQYWIKALNDGIVRRSPLPPDMWGTWVRANPPRPWIEYCWPAPVTINASRLFLFADQPAGSGSGVAPPRRWHLEYWKNGRRRVPGASSYGTARYLPDGSFPAGDDALPSHRVRGVGGRRRRRRNRGAGMGSAGAGRRAPAPTAGHAGSAVRRVGALRPIRYRMIGGGGSAPSVRNRGHEEGSPGFIRCGQMCRPPQGFERDTTSALMV